MQVGEGFKPPPPPDGLAPHQQTSKGAAKKNIRISTDIWRRVFPITLMEPRFRKQNIREYTDNFFTVYATRRRHFDGARLMVQPLYALWNKRMDGRIAASLNDLP